MNRSTTFLCIITLLFSFFSVKAQITDQDTQIPEEFYNQLEWRNIGPLRGGRSLGAAGARAHAPPRIPALELRR